MSKSSANAITARSSGGIRRLSGSGTAALKLSQTDAELKLTSNRTTDKGRAQKRISTSVDRHSGDEHHDAVERVDPADHGNIVRLSLTGPGSSSSSGEEEKQKQ